jgi:hypothetical protein
VYFQLRVFPSESHSIVFSSLRNRVSGRLAFMSQSMYSRLCPGDRSSTGALRFWQRQGYSFLCSLPQKARARDNIVSLLRKPLTALHKD